ncbi:MAG TPA: glycosyltransferase family 39 protein [Pyrinomonadaceae bacterium]|nr:glycosyltransferase family 39 protein [Pyrinomonadaceae bacterium]
MQQTDSIENQSKRFDIPWLAACSVITAIAAFLRFYDLALKPFHHDEGVNGFFLTTLFRDGVYKYDPANYHGPTLYYIAVAFVEVFGLKTVPVRASVAIFGVLTVVLTFFLRRYIGTIGSLSAGLFIALSPGMVFISRYFIHEIFFVFLSLGVVISVVYFIDQRKAGVFAITWMALILLACFSPSAIKMGTAFGGNNPTSVWAIRSGFFIIEAVLVFLVMRMLLAWNEGRPIYLLLAVSCVSLMFATKETAFITIGTMAIACGCVWIWQKISRRDEIVNNEINDVTLNWREFALGMGKSIDRTLIIAAATALFVYVFVLFFSSFFTHPEGVRSAFEAYTLWLKTGSKDHTQNGFWAYVKWMWEAEAPMLILSALGTAIAFIKARHRFAMFAGLWAFGLLLAYSIIPYKTPWLALSFLLPMCLVAGYGINELFASVKPLAIFLVIAAAGMMAYQTIDLNFYRYDDEDTAYVYAHTKRQFLDMVREIERYAEKSGNGKNARIEIVSPDYWPLVWYLNDYPKAVFHGSIADADQSDIIVAKKDEQDAAVISKYSARYRYVGTYALRPGVDLMLLVRKDIADPGAKELYLIER